MKQFFYTGILCLLMSINYAQNILVVNNTGNAAPEHYETLTDAYNTAVNGDIILLHGSITPYTMGADMNKQLTFYGPGFNLSSYPDTLVTNVNSAKIEPITIVDGAEGSAFFGVVIGSLKLDTDDLLFKGCQFVTSANTNTTDIKSNILMEGCYVGTSLRFSNTTQVTLRNSIMGAIEPGVSANMPGFILEHCIFTFPSIRNSNISNSISLATAGPSFINTNFDHTIFAISAPSNCTNCMENISCLTIFDSCTGDFELKYLNLKSNSPALNAASDGTDIGISGGIEPYKKSGIPAAPYINELIVPFTPNTNTMQVFIKATAEQ